MTSAAVAHSPSQFPSIPQLQIIRDPAKAAVFLQPARLRVLQELAAEPDSSSGIARKLDMPRQLVNYHMRELEKEGFVQFVEEHRRGNCMERIVRASAASYVVSPEALGALGQTGLTQDRFSLAYLIGAAARVIRELAALSVRAAKANKRLATLTMETEIRFRNAEERHRFADEFAAAMARWTAQYHDASAPGGRTFRILAAAYPATTNPPKEPDSYESAVIQ